MAVTREQDISECQEANALDALALALLGGKGRSLDPVGWLIQQGQGEIPDATWRRARSLRERADGIRWGVVARNRPLYTRTARSLCRSNDRLSMDDLVSEGDIGFLQGLRRWRLEGGHVPALYALPWALRDMQRYATRERTVVTVAHRQWARRNRLLQEQATRALTEEERSFVAGIRAEVALEDARDPACPPIAEEEIAQAQDRQRLNGAVSDLPELEELVFRLANGLGLQGRITASPQPFPQIAVLVQMQESSVRVCYERAERAIRKALQEAPEEQAPITCPEGEGVTEAPCPPPIVLPTGQLCFFFVGA